MKNANLPSLTSLRFFAAICVLISHSLSYLPNLIFIEYIGHLGYLGVPFFFSLSGFILSYNYDKDITYSRFIIKRIARIYPIHLLMLFICFFTTLIIGNPIAGYISTISGTVLNIILVHGWIPEHPNIRQAWNGVSWTLSCEFLFYILSPIIFYYIINLKLNYILLTLIITWSIITFISILADISNNNALNDFLWYSPFVHIVGFVAGATLAHAIKQTQFVNIIFKLKSFTPYILLYIITFVIIYNKLKFNEASTTSLLAYPLFLILISTVALFDLHNIKTILRNKILIYLGEISFCIYMVHAWLLGIFKILIVYIVNYFKFTFINESNFHIFNFAFLILFIVFCCIISIAFNHLFEKPMKNKITNLKIKFV